jgi:hypothetical protein
MSSPRSLWALTLSPTGTTSSRYSCQTRWAVRTPVTPRPSLLLQPPPPPPPLLCASDKLTLLPTQLTAAGRKRHCLSVCLLSAVSPLTLSPCPCHTLSCLVLSCHRQRQDADVREHLAGRLQPRGDPHLAGLRCTCEAHYERRGKERGEQGGPQVRAENGTNALFFFLAFWGCDRWFSLLVV